MPLPVPVDRSLGGLPQLNSSLPPVWLVREVLGTWTAASSSESGQRMSAAGDPVILMRPDTGTAGVAGFAVAAGIVTMVRARTAHAALVARQMEKPHIVGCRDIAMDIAANQARIGDVAICASDWVTIDGDSGHLYLGRLETVTTRPERELAEVARWRAERAAAENPMSKIPCSHESDRLSVDSSQMPELALV